MDAVQTEGGVAGGDLGAIEVADLDRDVALPHLRVDPLVDALARELELTQDPERAADVAGRNPSIAVTTLTLVATWWRSSATTIGQLRLLGDLEAGGAGAM